MNLDVFQVQVSDKLLDRKGKAVKTNHIVSSEVYEIYLHKEYHQILELITKITSEQI